MTVCRGSSSLLLFTYLFAEIAQLVEHNLAKVRVASSSLVFRSLFYFNDSINSCIFFDNFLILNHLLHRGNWDYTEILKD